MSGGQSIGVSVLASVLPMNILDLFPFSIDWFDLLAVQGTLESPLDSKEIKPVNPKGTKPQVFIERTDEAQIFWPSDGKS